MRGTSVKTTAEIIAAHQAGSTPQQLSAVYGLTTNGIRALLKRNGSYIPRPYGQNSLAKGWSLTEQGYKEIQVSEDWPHVAMAMRPRAGKPRVLEHRKVMADMLGRPLLDTETVHHKDGDKLNNVPENLQLRQGRHGNGVAYRCNCCGSIDVSPVELD